MKLIATDYKANEIMKIIREWLGITQEEMGRTIYRSGRTIRSYENNERHITLEDVLEIAKIHNINIIITKEKSGN